MRRCATGGSNTIMPDRIEVWPERRGRIRSGQWLGRGLRRFAPTEETRRRRDGTAAALNEYLVRGQKVYVADRVHQDEVDPIGGNIDVPLTGSILQPEIYTVAGQAKSGHVCEISPYEGLVSGLIRSHNVAALTVSDRVEEDQDLLVVRGLPKANSTALVASCETVHHESPRYGV
jgi:hypothetical protein